MKLFQFNKEFDEEDNNIGQSSTYVVATNIGEAIEIYDEGPNNNKEIWSVRPLGNPVLIGKELMK